MNSRVRSCMEQKWLLCDLHMHSQYSGVKKSGDKCRVKDMPASEYVDKLREAGVELFSITDHNYFADNYYDEIDKCINTNNLCMKIVNGVELDAYIELNKEKLESIHVCIYFSDAVNRKALHDAIDKLYKNGGKPLFENIIDRLFELKSKFIIIPHGDKQKGIFNLIKDIPSDNSDDFYKYAMYKIFNAFDVKPKFFSKSEGFWAAEFYKKTEKFQKIIERYNDVGLDALQNNIKSKIKDATKELSKDEQEVYDYIMRYGSYFAYFSFSDWHNAEKYDPKIKNFVFGSLEYGFEAIELATLDPVSRIEQSETENHIPVPSTLLKTVRFKIDGAEKEVNFSPGLNVIVGKRGSGKTLLLSVIFELANKGAGQGATKRYSGMNISGIVGEDRNGGVISPGGLSSAVFLDQDQIKEIFEDPNKAQDKIAQNFKEIKSLDLTMLRMMEKCAEKLKPYNGSYKNLTSHILSIKESHEYGFGLYDELNDVNLKKYFDDAISSLKSAVGEVDDIGLSSYGLEVELQGLRSCREELLKMIGLYNDVIRDNNETIAANRSQKSSRETVIAQSMSTIKTEVDKLKENFEIQLNYEELKVLIKNFSLNSLESPVELASKGKYWFATYYDIPDGVKDIVIEKITSAIPYAKELKDVGTYLCGEKQLKSGVRNIADDLKKYINGDTFSCKKGFYEVLDGSINFLREVRSKSDLDKYVSENKIRDLTDASLGTRSVAYLDMLFDLDESILVLDQPEDNIDNDYISKYLVPNIKNKKKIKQLIFVTHNPSVAVYGDAFNYIYVENDEGIKYANYYIEKKEDKDKLINILEGGRNSFSNRNKKFDNILGEEEWR